MTFSFYTNVQTQQKRQRTLVEKSSSSESEDESQEQVTTESDSPPSTSVGRGRGRGRGRGQGRGRGTRRGRRVFHARQLEEREEENLQQLHLECSQKATELIDQLSAEEAKELLNEMSSITPSVVLEVSDILTRRRNQEMGPPPQPSPDREVPGWCVCNNCMQMNTAIERVCCEMRPELCISLRPEMNLLILDPFTLHLQQRFRNDIFAREAHTPQDINKSLRHSAYRQYILWVHGRLHREDRRVVPSCCVKAIRRRFPDPNGQYKGFVPAFGVGW